MSSEGLLQFELIRPTEISAQASKSVTDVFSNLGLFFIFSPVDLSKRVTDPLWTEADD